MSRRGLEQPPRFMVAPPPSINRQQNPPRPTRFESHRAPPSSSPSFQPGAGVTLSQPSRPADVRRATTSAPHAIPSSSTSSSLTGALGHQTTAQPTKGAQMEGSSMSHENQRTRERAKQQVLVVMQTVQAARPDLLDVVVKLTLQKLLRLQRIALEPTTTLLVNTVAVPPEIRSYVQEISDLLTNALQVRI
ncbi:hypothetical protein BDW22DRAFT_357469 [Trametopsis cervina]|nr:hypothetical protein BDW22DRAFT_357469 [Trametopsis cervina]